MVFFPWASREDVKYSLTEKCANWAAKGGERGESMLETVEYDSGSGGMYISSSMGIGGWYTWGGIAMLLRAGPKSGGMKGAPPSRDGGDGITRDSEAVGVL